MKDQYTEAIPMLTELQNAAGIKSKQEIIRKYSDSEPFKTLLYYALNPMLSYNVSMTSLKESLNQRLSVECVAESSQNIISICEMLSRKRGVDKHDKQVIADFLASVDKDAREFFMNILSKELRLGITAKSVNKVIPGLIPEWEVQQAYSIEKYPLKEGTWFSLSEKLNGVRATYYRGSLIARSGEVFSGLDHILHELDVFGQHLVYDGELTLKDKGALSDNEAFRLATGIINSDADDKSAICFTIFDVLPADEFDAGESAEGYAHRRRALDELSRVVFDGAENVRVLPALYQGADQSTIDIFLDQMVREDKEGLMINLDVPYRRKRHNGILKVKRFYTMDLPIIDCEEGAGRLSGTLGALVVDFLGNPVRVGTGFSDEMRSALWHANDAVIGCLCEVKYKEISRDKKTGRQSLQFPVFMQLRMDKDTISYD